MGKVRKCLLFKLFPSPIPFLSNATVSIFSSWSENCLLWSPWVKSWWFRRCPSSPGKGQFQLIPMENGLSKQGWDGYLGVQICRISYAWWLSQPNRLWMWIPCVTILLVNCFTAGFLFTPAFFFFLLRLELSAGNSRSGEAEIWKSVQKMMGL